MCALQTPMPLTAISSAITSSSGKVIEAVEFQRAVDDMLGERTQIAHLGVAQAGRDAHLLLVVREHLGRGRGSAAVAGDKPAIDSAAALVETCWPMIDRTSTP